MAAPNKYDDPYWTDLASSVESKLDLPSGLLTSIVTNGEKSNNDRVSEKGAKTPFQIIPSTRNAAIKKYGIDPYLSPENAAEVAGNLLKDSLDRNKGDVKLAVAEYHGGTDRSGWGPRTKAYVDRVTSNLNTAVLPENTAPNTGKSQSTFDKLTANSQPENQMAAVHQAYVDGKMTPEESKQYESDVNSGSVMLPRGASLKTQAPTASEVLPQSVLDAYQNGQMNDQEKQQLESDINQGLVKLPNGASVNPNGGLVIPGLADQIPGQPRAPIVKEPETSIVDKAIGTGEAALSTATAATGGTAGQIGGTLGGLAASILDGSFGTPEAAKMVEEAAIAGGQALTYAPRTPEGHKQTQIVGDAAASLIPLTPLAGEMGAISSGAGLAGQLTKSKVAEALERRKLANSEVPITENNSVGAAATNPAEQARATASTASPEIQKIVEDAVKKNEDINIPALERHVEADSLPVKVPLTEGQALNDPVLISNEKNARGKRPELATRFNEQNKALSENLPAIREQAAPDVYAMDIPEHGDALVSSYKALDNELNTQIKAKYKALEEANGGDFPIDAQQFVKDAETNLKNKNRNHFIPGEVRALLDEYKDAQKMTFDNFEELRTILSSESRKAERAGDGNRVAAVSAVRDALESVPMSNEAANIKPLADAARTAAKARFDLLKADPAYKAVVDGTASPDKFIQKYIIGADVNKLRTLSKNLSADPQAQQVIASGVMKWLERQSGLLDGGGNFTQAGYNRGLEQIRPKLDIIFKPAQIKQIETLGKVARYVQNQPAGSFVNNSNTTVAAQATNQAKSAAETAANVALPGVNAGTMVRQAMERKAAEKAIQKTLAPGAGISKKKVKGK